MLSLNWVSEHPRTEGCPRDLRLSSHDLMSSGWRHWRALLLMRLACALIVYPALDRLWPASDSWWLCNSLRDHGQGAVAVTQRHLVGDDIGVLGHWQAFEGERGLSGLQGCRFQQPSVSRDRVAVLDQMMLPVTISAAGMLRRSPLRMTAASAADIARRAATAASARDSWT